MRHWLNKLPFSSVWAQQKSLRGALQGSPDAFPFPDSCQGVVWIVFGTVVLKRSNSGAADKIQLAGNSNFKSSVRMGLFICVHLVLLLTQPVIILFIFYSFFPLTEALTLTLCLIMA